MKILKYDDYMTSLDDKKGYHQGLVDRESRSILAFEFLGRYFCYRAMPFGAPAAPAFYQALNMIVAVSFILACEKARLYIRRMSEVIRLAYITEKEYIFIDTRLKQVSWPIAGIWELRG